MNPSTAVFLINSNVRAIQSIYDPHIPGQAEPKRQTFKTLDQTIKVGDYILVPSGTRHNMTANKVVAVDVDVDFDSNVQMTWVVGKIDRTTYEQTLAMEAKALEVIRSADLRAKREKLKGELLADQQAKEAMLALPITTAGAPEITS